jgi:hypothetical protein
VKFQTKRKALVIGALLVAAVATTAGSCDGK